jgi:hypothetical protein
VQFVNVGLLLAVKFPPAINMPPPYEAEQFIIFSDLDTLTSFCAYIAPP